MGDILNDIKVLLKGANVSFSEKKDNIKELNQMTVKKKLINEKKRVNVKETIGRKKEMLKNEGDALNKIDEAQKVPNVLNQNQKNLLDKMLIRVKQASIGKKKSDNNKDNGKDNDKDDDKEKYYPGYHGYGYSAPVYHGYGYSAPAYHAYGYSAPGVVTTHTHTYYPQPYDGRRKATTIGSAIGSFMFVCAIITAYYCFCKKDDDDCSSW